MKKLQAKSYRGGRVERMSKLFDDLRKSLDVKTIVFIDSDYVFYHNEKYHCNSCENNFDLPDSENGSCCPYCKSENYIINTKQISEKPMAKQVEINCPTCDGKKKVDATLQGDKKIQINCPTCRGHGKIKVNAKDAK